MTYQIGSGNLASLTLADSGVIGRYKQIGEVNFEIGDEDVSGLDTEDFSEFEPHDLATMGDTEVELFFNTKANLLPAGDTPTAPYIRLGHKELMTITYPERSDESAPASLAAWAFFKKIGLPTLVNNTTLMIKCTIRWCNRDDDGVATPPVWTKAVAAV